ncbi:hypothetical protein QBC38DRAFT_425113 [Podospora fimiseda]|uniref:Uncharacterized protein n=1 Tax=Podospora fimiseda TaxID=252190 RepID=A0AAN7BI50_9PEZI|nr:hypothetical protein QBC38DRAFT_425113 [Podospora fimiseda]
MIVFSLILWIITASTSAWTPIQQINNTLAPQDDPPCHFLDNWGPVPCDSFSVVFGNPAPWIGKNTCARFYVKVTTNGFQNRTLLSCDNNGDVWTPINLAPLEYEIGIHTGNLCFQGYKCDDVKGRYDNTWIRYANQWVNAPTDGRCVFISWRDGDGNTEGDVEGMGGSRYIPEKKSLRCIIGSEPA